MYLSNPDQKEHMHPRVLQILDKRKRVKGSPKTKRQKLKEKGMSENTAGEETRGK
jgi:hypothetical protein